MELVESGGGGVVSASVARDRVRGGGAGEMWKVDGGIPARTLSI